MFSLHERIQRRVCRTAFVAFCALPTIVVIGWAAYFNRPWSERDWQHSIEHTLHVGAEISAVSAPQPLVRRISKLSLTDLKSKSLLIEVDELLVHSAEEVEARNITIHVNQFADIATAVQIWLTGNDFSDVNWHVGKMTLIGLAGQQFQLDDVAIQSQSAPTGARQIVVRCSSGPELVIERSASGATRCRFESTQTKLPAWLLADTMPGASRWLRASFTGTLQLQKSHGSLSGSFEGEVDAIDCREWIGSDSLLTQAKLRMEEFTWESGRVETMQGWLETTEGLISTELLKSLHRVLTCQVVDETLLHSSEAIRFDKLACRFRLNSAGLTCVDPATINNPQANGPGILITSQGKPLVMQPAYSNLPLANFVQLFFPVERDVLPGTREATEMGDKLPLPETTK
jgi:hypothetical protein